MTWDEVFERHWEMYDPAGSGGRWRGPAASHDEILNVEAAIGFTFPSEFHACYHAANGFGIDYPILVPLDDLPGFISHSRARLVRSYPEVASRFVPFIDIEAGPTGYFVESNGEVSEFMRLLETSNDFDDPDLTLDDFFFHSAQSIWAYLIT